MAVARRAFDDGRAVRRSTGNTIFQTGRVEALQAPGITTS